MNIRYWESNLPVWIIIGLNCILFFGGIALVFMFGDSLIDSLGKFCETPGVPFFIGIALGYWVGYSIGKQRAKDETEALAPRGADAERLQALAAERANLERAIRAADHGKTET